MLQIHIEILHDIMILKHLLLQIILLIVYPISEVIKENMVDFIAQMEHIYNIMYFIHNDLKSDFQILIYIKIILINFQVYFPDLIISTSK